MPSAVVPFDTPIEFVHLAGDIVAALLGIEHGVDGQQRRLGLHVMHVLRIG